MVTRRFESATIKVACRHLWKLFGPNAERFLAAATSNPSAEEFAAAGLIAAVRNVDLEVRQGEIFVIMGLSGSGKSTLVRCMSRLVEPTAGEALFDGQDLVRLPERQLIELRRHKMGMVFQHFALLSHLTVLDNVGFPLRIQGVRKAERDEQARRVIELVGLTGREDNYPRELSGGQQQRVGIARSLAVNPEVWFLDEPFSALDPLIRHEMQDEFLRLQRLLNKTIVFITHDFDEAIRLADRIAVMKDGEVVQSGTAEELVTKPATDYVREFTRGVAKVKVLTVAAVMAPADEAGALESAPTVLAHERLSAVARKVLASPQPVAVRGSNGRVVGTLTRQHIIDALTDTMLP